MSRGIFPLEEQNSRIQNVKHETGISLQAFTCNHGRRRYKVDLKGHGRGNKRYEAKTRNSFNHMLEKITKFFVFICL